jgi:ABC-type dipeptide/oligopeptide/nickel transport system permease component
VLDYVGQRLPASLALASVAFALVLVVGIPAGVLAAVKSGTVVDHVVMTVAILGQAVPAFWLGLLMIILFAVRLRVLPPFGFGSAAHLVMPALTLALLQTGLVARVTRSEMLGVLSQDYIRTARAKGLLETRVVAKHALRNALIPLITVLGIQFGTLVGGAVVTETVFGWPGIGNLVVNAVYQRDYPVVQGVVLLLAGAFVMINFVVDSLYAALDPRVVYV